MPKKKKIKKVKKTKFNKKSKEFEGIKANLEYAGKIARENNQRLSFHPGPFNILSSPKEKVVQSSIIDLTRHGEIMDTLAFLLLPPTVLAAVNAGCCCSCRRLFTMTWSSASMTWWLAWVTTKTFDDVSVAMLVRSG